MDALLAAGAASHDPSDPHAANVLHVLALDSLAPSLRFAFHHVLTVLAQRHPFYFLHAHRFRDEVHLAVSALLEAHSLRRHGTSFSEHFYGVHRVPTGTRSPSFAVMPATYFEFAFMM